MPPSFIAAVLPYLIGFAVLISGTVYSYRKGWDNRDNLAKTRSSHNRSTGAAADRASTPGGSNDQGQQRQIFIPGSV